MLARRLPGILPPLDPDEALTVTTIHSVAGQLPPGGGLLRHRPFRSPHHTCSDVALVGGGSTPRPGELSLAHGGVLFLDELPEFSRRVLETLRQPLEHGLVHIARANHSVTFPANVMLVGAMNPCPCGFLGSPHRPCRCPPLAVERYQRRLSGPAAGPLRPLARDSGAAVGGHAGRRGQPSPLPSSASASIAARGRQQARQGCTNARLDGTEASTSLRARRDRGRSVARPRRRALRAERQGGDTSAPGRADARRSRPRTGHPEGARRRSAAAERPGFGRLTGDSCRYSYRCCGKVLKFATEVSMEHSSVA